VVGRKPSQKLQDLAARNKGVRITGWVEDIRPYLARSAVCIVPLRIGGGTRLKIFEAMAMGKAVVSTTIGAEGLPCGIMKASCWPMVPRTSPADGELVA